MAVRGQNSQIQLNMFGKIKVFDVTSSPQKMFYISLLFSFLFNDLLLPFLVKST